MSQILLISGSPTAPSKSAALLQYATTYLHSHGLTAETVSVRDFSAEDLIQARFDSPSFEGFKAKIAAASGIIVATPIYKASYTGSLKALLDILPQTALRGKTILPLATGGSPAHLLAIDYALKPVLAVLGASDIQQGVYVTDSQYQVNDDGFTLADDLQTRLDESLARLVLTVKTLVAAQANAA
ncbi:MAG: NADPH-dependent FMN reductase [Luteolibacter sp.]